MPGINSRVAAFATVTLSLSFDATGAAPALAQQTQTSPRVTVHRHVAYRLVRARYAGPASSSSRPVAKWRTRPTGGVSCALPSSGCPDDERITN